VEFGEFIQRVTDSLKDNKVTRNEAKQCQKELAELIAAATTLNALLAAKAESAWIAGSHCWPDSDRVTRRESRMRCLPAARWNGCLSMVRVSVA
jgi:hypothetical protein